MQLFPVGAVRTHPSRRRWSFCSQSIALLQNSALGDTACKNDRPIVFAALPYGPEPNRLCRGLDFAKQIGKKEKSELISSDFSFFGDPYGNRTHVTAVKGPCLNRLTNGPYERLSAGNRRIILVAGIGLEPMTYRV